ncbi:MAG: hypothetical protein KI792_08925 [Alphaproteobacteria bacterium]|nr:hypothetical protein [Alphaproteobacteria bacterium SS10]
MALITTICWALLALLHLAPAAVLAMPGLTQSLYQLDPNGTAGVLIIHRGALFLGIVVVAVWAAFDHRARPVASVVTAISMIGFLLVYARAGLPDGALRTIAIADLIGLAPLAIASYQCWVRTCEIDPMG